MSENGNKPAFVALEVEGAGLGLTKRELFAAMALQGLLAHHGNDEYDYRALARCAVWRANALLSELAKEGES